MKIPHDIAIVNNGVEQSDIVVEVESDTDVGEVKWRTEYTLQGVNNQSRSEDDQTRIRDTIDYALPGKHWIRFVVDGVETEEEVYFDQTGVPDNERIAFYINPDGTTRTIHAVS